MINLAIKQENGSAWIGVGCVTDFLSDHWLVDTEFGRIEAERADGCLIEPAVGDRVLMVLAGPGESYILNILKRAGQQPKTISVEGDTGIKVRGRLDLMAESVRVGSAEELSVQAEHLGLSFLKGRARFGNLDLNGGQVSSRLDTLRLAARRIENVAERVLDRFTRHYRRVEDFEDARVGRLRFWVTDLFSVRSKSTAIKADDQVKVDADKILLG